jgi:hypothetical protein
VGGAEERMYVFEFGAGDLRAMEICLYLEKRDVILEMNDDTRK